MSAPYKYARNYDPLPKNKNGVQYFYRMLVSFGVLLTEHNGELIIQTADNNVSPVLRKSIEARKAALIKHMRSLSR